MAKDKRVIIQFILAWVVVFLGLGLIAASFIVPPLGTISPSVLAAFGEILTFAGAVLGIDYSYRKRLLTTRKQDDDVSKKQ